MRTAFVYCKKCVAFKTHHPVANVKDRFACGVCGNVRHYAKSFGAGDFPELTADEKLRRAEDALRKATGGD